MEVLGQRFDGVRLSPLLAHATDGMPKAEVGRGESVG